MVVFWIVAPSGLLVYTNVWSNFRISALKMEAVYSTETIVACIVERPHGANNHKTTIFSHIQVKTSNPTKYFLKTGSFHPQVKRWGIPTQLCPWTSD
jgi:hypothetical protein